MDYITYDADEECVVAITGNPAHPENNNVLYRGSAASCNKAMQALERFLSSDLEDDVLVLEETITEPA
jgi:hypothetical protein